MGHLVSMVELAKVLLGNGLSITILMVEPHYNTGATAPFISAVSAAHPSIAFHHLPSLSPPPNSSPHREAQAMDLLRLSNPNLQSFLQSSSPSPAALIIDFFCGFALNVSSHLRIPTYCFFTSGACFLAVFLKLPNIHSRFSVSFRELGSTLIDVPGIPSIPADHMPLVLLDRDDEAYKGFYYLSERCSESDGIIVNTFDALEPRTIEAISRDGMKLYCTGPLITEERDMTNGADCLEWLDGQPRGSVVFLCFGSLGLFSVEQLREIAIGLERSGQRFLWVVRSPPSDDPAKRFAKPAEAVLHVLLPDGFLNRTGDRGMVVKSWAPQTAVLRHPSVGGFVTHCGWNSILEAICTGVPMVGWPLYAEQRVNIIFLVEEMKLAAAMEGYDSPLVSAEEVETRVGWLMDSDGGRELRLRTEAAKKAAATALQEGGSSREALVELVARLKRR
nr:UDP-glycosyltransferase [Paris polyphylla]